MNNNVRPFLHLVVIAGISVLTYLLVPILTPFLIAFLIAYISNPLVTKLERRGVPRSLTIAVLFVFVFIVFLGLVLVLVPLVQKQLAAFAAKLPGYFEWLQAKLAQWDSELPALDMETIRRQLLQQWQDVGKWTATALSYATYSGARLFGWFLNLILIPVVTFYLLRDWDEILRHLYNLLPERTRGRLPPLAQEIDATLAGFLRGQLSVMLALAVVYSAGLALVGLDLAVPIGLLAGLISFIPYLGFFVGILVAGVAALLQFQDGVHLLWVGAVFMAGQVLESLVLTPRLVGGRIGLHPVVVIFAVMAGGQLFGFFGILLAVPAAAVLMVWMRHLRGNGNGKNGVVKKYSSRS